MWNPFTLWKRKKADLHYPRKAPPRGKPRTSVSGDGGGWYRTRGANRFDFTMLCYFNPSRNLLKILPQPRSKPCSFALGHFTAQMQLPWGWSKEAVTAAKDECQLKKRTCAAWKAAQVSKSGKETRQQKINMVALSREKMSNEKHRTFSQCSPFSVTCFCHLGDHSSNGWHKNKSDH